MKSNFSLNKERKITENKISSFLNIGIYLSITNILFFGFIILGISQIFLDILNFYFWVSFTSVFGLFFIVIFFSLIMLLVKIIVNNQLFIQDIKIEKDLKKYFSLATVLFFLNTIVSLLMFKKILIGNSKD